MLKQIYERDIDRIAYVEKRAFIPSMRADTEVILRRLRSGHIMIGDEVDGRLIGTAAFRYAKFNPHENGSFPSTFEDFAETSTEDDYDSVFGYSLGVLPGYRNLARAKALFDAGVKRAVDDGCVRGVVHGSCSSYNGSSQFPRIETIEQSPEFRRAIDRYLNGGEFPLLRDFLYDPLLAFYSRIMKLKFLRVILDFFPKDVRSGGIGVILFKEFA